MGMVGLGACRKSITCQQKREISFTTNVGIFSALICRVRFLIGEGIKGIIGALIRGMLYSSEGKLNTLGWLFIMILFSWEGGNFWRKNISLFKIPLEYPGV